MTDSHATSGNATEAIPASWQRLFALSGIAFAVLLCLAWFSNGAETPHYTAPDHDWMTWANNTEMKGRFAAFFALLAGLVFLPFAATNRDMLGRAERNDDGHNAWRAGITSYRTLPAANLSGSFEAHA